MNTNQTTHLTPFEKAARIYCQHTGQDPDTQIPVPHPVIAGMAVPTPLWHRVAERMLDLSMLLAAMKAAAKETDA